jgi:uncharacterized protein YqeY
MLKNDIQNTVNNYLKARKTLEVKVLRFILSEIKYAEIEKQKELTDTEVISLLQKEIKKRREAIEMFKKGNRSDLVTDEKAQMAVIMKFLPKALSKEELEKIVDEVFSTLGEEKNMGKIIGLVMAKVKGKADGSVVASLVRQKLQE